MTEPTPEPRRATDAEIATARAWAYDNPDAWEAWALDEDLDQAKAREYEHALEVLVFAAGGRYTEPRQPGGHQPSQGQDIPDDQLEAIHDEANHSGPPTIDAARAARRAIRMTYRVAYAAALGYEITVEDGRVKVGDRPEPAPPRVQARTTSDGKIWFEVDGLWRTLSDHSGRYSLTALEELFGATRVVSVATGEDPDPTSFEGILHNALAATGDDTQPVPTYNGNPRRRTIAFNALTRGLAAADRFVALHEREAIAVVILTALDGDQPTPDQPPVTPAADLADEAAHERVAHALSTITMPGEGDHGAVWSHADHRERMYVLAKAAIDAYRTDLPSVAAALDMLDNANRRAGRFAEQLGSLAQGLRERGIRREPTGFVAAALAHIDRLSTALDEATSDATELETALIDGGLTAAQEIAAEALADASRLLAGSLTRYADPVAVTAAGDAALTLADRFEQRIRGAGLEAS